MAKFLIQDEHTRPQLLQVNACVDAAVEVAIELVVVCDQQPVADAEQVTVPLICKDVDLGCTFASTVLAAEDFGGRV